MKNFVLFILAMCLIGNASAQLKTTQKCDAFVVDILDGKVNDVHLGFTKGQIETKLPCFTGEDPETSKCGGVIYYKNQDIKFYTGRNYVEIGPNFKGKLSIPLMGGKRGSFYKWLGLPKIKDTNWDAYETQYGCLILYYNAQSKVNLIRFSSKTTDEINLCE